MRPASPSSPVATGRSKASRPAVLFDLVAVLGLIAVAVGAFVRGEALGLVFLGALAGVTVIPGAVLSGIALRHAARSRKWRRSRFVMTVVGLGLTAALVGPVVLTLSWNATPNPAAAVAAPLEAQIRAAGGRQLCSDGDPGRGPDNFAAWHEAYYTVPQASPILRHLQSATTTAGFTPFRRVPNRASSFPDSQRFTAQPVATTTQHDGLSVELSPTGTQLNCGSAYGRTFRTSDHEVVVDLTTTIDPVP